jgi:Gpi18-like mannosyltransferase
MTVTKKKIVVPVFFCLLLAIGLWVHKDYGISWDEPFQRDYGHAVYNYVTKGDPTMLEGPNKYYGPAFEMLLLFLETSLGLNDSRQVYLMRHLASFILFFVAVIVFYRFCKQLFGDWRIAILGCTFLVISPRIFAHAFFNSKDIPALSLYVIGMFTLVRFLDSGTFGRAAVHAFVCAVLIDIRIIGIMLPALTVGFVAGDLIRTRAGRADIRRVLLRLAAYLGMLVLMVIAFWPTMWDGPVHHFMRAFEEMSHYPLSLPVRYMGQFIWPKDFPWHYTSVWIAITTPIAYTACFIAGVAAAVAFLSRRYRFFPLRMRDLILLLLWFFLPVVYLPISNAVVFDEWRHTFFVYPAFVGIALVGLVTALRSINGRLRRVYRTVAGLALLTAVAIGIANTARIMVQTHPYQNLYFNALVGGIKGADGKFDLDYWGLSYREALEYILRKDRSPTVSVSVYSRPGRSNAQILLPQARSRLKYLDNPYEATYFLSHGRWNPLHYPPREEFFAVRLDGVYIMVVLKDTSMDSIVTVGAARK